MRILIVEDEPLVALSLAWELGDAGHEVIGPATAIEEALQQAKLHHAELALLDIDLQQRGDGVRLARQLHDIGVPAVFVSGQNAIAHENSDVAIGYISKPYNPLEIVKSVAVVDAIIHGAMPPPPSIPAALELFHNQ